MGWREEDDLDDLVDVLVDALVDAREDSMLELDPTLSASEENSPSLSEVMVCSTAEGGTK